MAVPVLYPAARWRPLGRQTQPRMRAHDVVVLHTMAGSLAGTDAYFRGQGYGGTESHFGVGPAGEVYQWQDLEHQADAQLDGNGRCISIETADRGSPFPAWSGSDVPAWTDQQEQALAGLLAWLAGRYDIPLQLVPDSRPGRRGIGWHRLGIDPWRAPGGEVWSTTRGKPCPGERRIAQIPEVIDEARRITQRGADMTPDERERLRRVERGVELIVQQLIGPGATLENPWPGADDQHGGGWPDWRGTQRPPRLTLVDFVRRLDADVHAEQDEQRGVPLYPSQEVDRHGDG